MVIAATGQARRDLPTELPTDLNLAEGFSAPRVALPGVLAVQGPPAQPGRGEPDAELERFCGRFPVDAPLNRFPLVVVVDDSEFVARTLNNFLWAVFTRSNPASDIYGIGASIRSKHWGCEGALVIDARRKPHHAPPLLDDPAVEKRVDALGAPGGPLHGII